MFIWRELAAVLALCWAVNANAQTAAPSPVQTTYPGIGRAATPNEVTAWDIDVRPDLKGLPAGSGSVAKGQVVWEAQCASCHGFFGESNEVFSPLVGGTTKDDVKTGRVARLNDRTFPSRTTLMKLPTVSTLWDYINRAMPWNAPKSLSTEEVYAVTAYMLNLGGVVPDNFTLSNSNMAEVQKLLPNRGGMTTDHGLWPGTGMGDGVGEKRADVKALACMKDCAAAPTVASVMPDFARNQHGNLADQQRLVGPQRGANTGKAQAAVAIDSTGKTSASSNADAQALLQKHSCTACHGAEQKIVGPGFKEIAVKYAGDNSVEAYLLGKIRAGGQGVWGNIPMPAQSLSPADAKAIATWLAAGALK
jgi:S-disulfanyl-L-cysteine oxidoreductase SoxD